MPIMYSPRAVVLPAVFDQGHRHTQAVALVYFASESEWGHRHAVGWTHLSSHLHFFFVMMGSYPPRPAGSRHRLQLTA